MKTCPVEQENCKKSVLKFFIEKPVCFDFYYILFKAIAQNLLVVIAYEIQDIYYIQLE